MNIHMASPIDYSACVYLFWQGISLLAGVCIFTCIYRKRYTHMNIHMASPIDYSTFHIKWISSKTRSINSKASCIFPKEIYTYTYTHDISYRLLNYLFQVDIFKS